MTYERYFGLRERPFMLTPNPRFLLLTAKHREALGNLEYGITSMQGMTVLVGEAGTGKTTVVRRALAIQMEKHEPRTTSVYLNNPALTRSEFFEFLADSFDIGPEAAASKTRFLREFERTLRARREAGELSVLVIDEAQSLPHELLEEIRLLANIESDTEKLLPVVLAGQPELAERLNESQLRQFKQRVGLRCTLSPLTLRETAAYIAGRVRLAGGDAVQLFSRDAVVAVHQWARGIPRTISVICDNALLTAFALARRPVDDEVVADVARDFDLGTAAPSAPSSGRTSERAPKVHPFRPAAGQPSGGPSTKGIVRRLSERLREPR